MAVSKETTPFEYLLSVDHKCDAHHGGLVQQEFDASYSHGLAFLLGAHKYIIPIADVSEVLSVKDFTSIPRSPDSSQAASQDRYRAETATRRV